MSEAVLDGKKHGLKRDPRHRRFVELLVDGQTTRRQPSEIKDVKSTNTEATFIVHVIWEFDFSMLLDSQKC